MINHLHPILCRRWLKPGHLSDGLLLLALLLFLPFNVARAQETPPSLAAMDRRYTEIRHLDLKYSPRPVPDRQGWEVRAGQLRQQILGATGLLPMPEKGPLNPVIFGRVDRGTYTVEKIYFESYPGFYVTGNLYRPKVSNGQKVPAVLCPHGHWTYGRLEKNHRSIC